MPGEFSWVEPSGNKQQRRRTTGHLTVRSGKRVLVFFQNGEKKLLRFKESGKRFVKFFDGPDIPTKDIATISIYKPKQD